MRGGLKGRESAFSHTILPREDYGLNTIQPTANPSSFKHDQITGGSVSINPSVYSRSSRKRSSDRLDSLGTVNVDLFTDQSIKKGCSKQQSHDQDQLSARLRKSEMRTIDEPPIVSQSSYIEELK